MKSILSFYVNSLLKLSLSQSIFNYNIHFLNVVSVRWRPLLSTHSPQAFLEVLHHSLQHVGRNCCHFFPDVLFKNPPLSLVSFRTLYSWDILRGRSIATRDTRSDKYWSADEISSESRQNRCFWNTSPQQKPDALQTSALRQLKCFQYR